MKYYEDTHAEVNYYKEAKTVEVIWKAPNADSTRYRMTMTKALVVMKKYDVCFWISDLSSVSKLTREDKIWVRNTLLPNLVNEKLKKTALVAKEGLMDHNDKRILQENALKNNFEITIFRTIREAYEWIGVPIK